MHIKSIIECFMIYCKVNNICSLLIAHCSLLIALIIMHSYLITGGSYENRKTKESDLCLLWNVQPCDIFQIRIEEGKQSIGIENVRLLTHTLSLSPRLSSVVAGIIDQAEKLTPEAQNALLKTLEEPPPKARIIIETENDSVLLPTIVSRCQIIPVHTVVSITQEEKRKNLELLQTFQGKKPGEISHMVTQLFDKKEEGAEFLHNLLLTLHASLHTPLSEKHREGFDSWNFHQQIRAIRSVLKAQRLLSCHVQHHLVFDDFFQTILLYKR